MLEASDPSLAARARRPGFTPVTNKTREFRRVPEWVVEDWTTGVKLAFPVCPESGNPGYPDRQLEPVIFVSGLTRFG
jgi:hypothetical protein